MKGSILFWLMVIASQINVWAESSGFPQLQLVPAFPGQKFKRPLWMEEAPDGSRRTVVIEQAGKILMLSPGQASSNWTVFADLTERHPMVQNEEGLLAFAFHPGFKTNGACYLFYSQQSPKRVVLSAVKVSGSDPNKLDLTTERVLLEILKPYWNHNGGTLLFGPDGYLYLSLGDGGLGGDPHNVGQSGHHLLGKILRLDVNSRYGKLPYGIPKDNPFAGKDEKGNLKPDPFDTKPEGVRPEIWAYGLRNVWRMSFDRETGELWAGDVGQDKWEEVDLITKGGNYGWSVREGFHDFKNVKPQGTPIDPVIEYAHNPALAKESKFPEHSPGVSITGGYVYRGKKIPSLQGVYIYADFVMGTVWGLRAEKGKAAGQATLIPTNPALQPASFGQDAAGEVYLLSFDGNIYALREKKN
jgi:glucose/arabinose dehydrogenase